MNHYHYFPTNPAHMAEFESIRLAIANVRKLIMATQAEHAQALRDLKAQNEKVAAEHQAALAAATTRLEEAIAASGSTSPEVDTALAELRAVVQAEDAKNPDASPAPAPAPSPAPPPPPVVVDPIPLKDARR